MITAMPTRRVWLTAAFPLLTHCARPQRTVIGVIPKAIGHLFFAAVHAGVKRAAAEAKVDYLWNGPQEETDHNRQIEIVDSMVNSRVTAIAISATDHRALKAPVERAMAQGIPVSVFDSGVDVEGYVTFVATDNRQAGVDAARRIAALIGGRGKVGMVMHKPGGASTGLREEGFEETLAREFPNIAIAARQYSMSDHAKARAAAENMLTGHPDLAALFASSEASSLGAIRALQSRGQNGKVRLITFDTSSTHIEALENGTTDVMMVQDSGRIGYEAVRSLTMKLKGGQPPKRIDLPVRFIVKADLGKPEITDLLHPKTE
jgi:ribose transport system substrate-binding protein